MKKKMFLLLISVMLLTGCGVGDPITGEDFSKFARKNDYVIKDHTTNFAYADTAYLINDEIYIFFLDGKKKYDVEGLFLDECKNAYQEAGDDYSKKTRGGDDWLVLELNTDDKFFYLSMIEDTFVIVKSTQEKKSLAKDMIDELGY